MPNDEAEKWAVETPYAILGAVALPIVVATAPVWGPAVIPASVAALKGVVAAGGIATVVTGTALTGAGAFLPPSETRLEELGWYGRGVEEYWLPGMEKTREVIPGLPGELATGLAGYFAPHELVGKMYPEKGPKALATLVPHFGPTALAATLTIGEVPAWQTALGYGFAALPYAVGPLGAVVSKVGPAVGKVPVLGPTLKVVTAPARWGMDILQAGAKGIRLEQWAPWRAAYGVSGLAGKAGLAKIPRLGTAGARWGWWKGPPVSKVIPGDVELPPFKRTYIDLEEAMKGPQTLTGKALDKALYGKQPTPGQLKAMEARFSKLLGPVQPAPEHRFWMPGYESAGVVQQMQMPSGWRQITQIARQVGASIPKVAMAGALAAPVVGTAFLPIVSPISLPAETVVPSITVPTPVVGVAVPSIPILAKIDIATVDQMLTKEQITPTQHEHIVAEVETLQAQEVTTPVYEQGIQTTIQQQLNKIQQQQFEVQEQVVTQEQAEEIQQQIVQQTEILSQIQKEQVQPEIVTGQIQTIQDLQQIYDQIITQMDITTPTPPTFYEPVPIIPIIPWLPEAPSGGTGIAGRRRGRRGLFEEKGWVFPKMVMVIQDPLTGERLRTVLSEKRKVAYGARRAGTRRKTPVARAKGIRI